MSAELAEFVAMGGGLAFGADLHLLTQHVAVPDRVDARAASVLPESARIRTASVRAAALRPRRKQPPVLPAGQPGLPGLALTRVRLGGGEPLIGLDAGPG